MGCQMPTYRELFLSQGIRCEETENRARDHGHLSSELGHLKAMFLDLVILASHRKASNKLRLNIVSSAFIEGS